MKMIICDGFYIGGINSANAIAVLHFCKYLTRSVCSDILMIIYS